MVGGQHESSLHASDYAPLSHSADHRELRACRLDPEVLLRAMNLWQSAAD